jgi:hypothetical protein
LLCLGAQLSTALHALLVEHTRCAEHGEWVHVEREHADGHVAARGDPAPDGPVFSAPHAADDHCLVCSDVRKLAVLTASSPGLRAPTLHAEAAPNGKRWSVRSASIYSFAPKTSPPA